MRELVLTVPGATLAFERFHVDYCCGGGKSLAEACTAAGAELGAVLAALEEEAARPGAEIAGGEMLSVPLERLVAQLLDVHHVRSREAAARLPGLARQVYEAEATSADGPELGRIAEGVDRLFADLLLHLAFEERHVFPYVVALERAGREDSAPPVALFGSISEPIADMEREHDAADRAVHELHRRAEAMAPRASEAARALFAELDAHERELVRHMHLEGNVLLPRALRLEQKIARSRRR